MKGLIKNYIDSLTIQKLNDFGLKNNINLNTQELNFLLNLVKNNWEDILKDETKYLDKLNQNININDFIKIKKLFFYYKDRYKGYLF